MNTSQKLVGLARILVQNQLLTEAQANEAHKQALGMNTAFISQLVQSKKLKSLVIAEAAAHAFGLPIFDLNALPSNFVPSKNIEPTLMQSKRIMPLMSRGNTLFVAVSDPTEASQTLDEIKFQVGLTISTILVEEDKLAKWIDKLTENNEATMQSLLSDSDSSEDAPKNGGDQQTIEVDDAPVVKYIQKILLDAINLGASDIHFEPYEKFYRIRYRIDGILREIGQPPLTIKEKMASRIKVISNLDISEKRIPQDGRMKLTLSQTRHIDFRVSTLPMINGEKS